MFTTVLKFMTIATLILGGVAIANAQAELPDASIRGRNRTAGDRPVGFKDLLAKQRAERDKKDHEEMLERGDEALMLAKQLEASFEQNKAVSPQDRNRLESLENVVQKIRKELGGDDDDDMRDRNEFALDDQELKPSNFEDAFKYLQSTTVKLVEELKKTTRFTISAVAIQTSNNVLKEVRFLRLKK